LDDFESGFEGESEDDFEGNFEEDFEIDESNCCLTGFNEYCSDFPTTVGHSVSIDLPLSVNLNLGNFGDTDVLDDRELSE